MTSSSLRDQWVAALRSGKYVQGRGALRHQGHDGVDTYCCLGVLCDVAIPNGWRPSRDPRIVAHLGVEGRPVPQVTEAVGLTDPEVSMLMEINDRGHSDFRQIADMVEKRKIAASVRNV